MSLFKTFICEREDLPKPENFSIVSPDGSKILFTGTLSRCWDKREFFENKYLKSPHVVKENNLPKQLEFQFDEI